ncbi:MAG: 12-oxophytodienoate reductase [Polyangiales bacterium]
MPRILRKVSERMQLQTPFEHPKISLRNRVVMAPMTRNRSPFGVPTDEVAAYYARRAEHGVGLIITEAALVPHPGASAYKDVPTLYGDDAAIGWRKVTNAVHQQGSKIFTQLWHVGSIRRLGKDPNPDTPGVAPSALIHPAYREKGPVPHELTENEIAEIVKAYANATSFAQQVGFDGVEIHGAHGYLIDQFFWTATNQRNDRYGGSWNNRSRFAAEIVTAIRKSVGEDFPIVFRFSQWKLGDYTHQLVTSPDEITDWLGPVVDAGVDILHASSRRYWEPEFENSTLNLAGWCKKIFGMPVITVGSVGLDHDVVHTNAGGTCGQTGIEALSKRLANDGI